MTLREDGPDRLVGRSGGGCVSLFGLPFLIFGLAFLIAGGMGKVADSKTGHPTELLFLVPFSLIFMAVGAAFVFGRRGIIIDRSTRRATAWWGLLSPFYRRERPLNGLAEVSVSREVRKGNKSTTTVYPVRLKGGSAPFNVVEPTDYEEARRSAEQIAKFLGLPMVDNSTGQAVRREADELDMPLRDQLARRGQDIAWPEPPAGMRCTYEVADDTVTIDVPRNRLSPIRKLSMISGLVPAIVILIVLHSSGLLRGHGAHDVFRLPLLMFFGAICILPLAATVFSGLLLAMRRVRITASPRELRVTTRGLLTHEEAIPTNELEELIVTPRPAGMPAFLASILGSPPLIARSDRLTITISLDVTPEELDWIHKAILYVVTGAA